ncbi:hypothetical protein C0J26_03215 [Pseudomonas baetica]|nr:hypothetical protein C0J26_03215 [Pseudomonas baetica]
MLTSLVLFMTGNKFAHYMQILGFVAGAMTTYWIQGSLFSANSMCIALNEPHERQDTVSPLR